MVPQTNKHKTLQMAELQLMGRVLASCMRPWVPLTILPEVPTLKRNYILLKVFACSFQSCL